MAEIKIIDLKSGKENKGVKVDDSFFKLPLRRDLLNEYVTMQGRQWRQGTHSTKTRAEVSGTGKKPFRQKGTGNARQGTLRGPHQEGGGIAFGPKPRNYSTKLNKKTKKLAIKTAVSQKLYEKKLFAIENFEVSSGKTKDAAECLKKLDAKSCLIVGSFSEETLRSTKNIPNCKLISPGFINIRDLFLYEKCFLTLPALDSLNQYFAGTTKTEKAA